MICFDTDVFVEILSDNPRFVRRLAQIPVDQQSTSVVTIEEILRGRLHAVRLAEAGKSKTSLVRAYELLIAAVLDFQGVQILPYTPGAESLYEEWKKQRVRVGAHDLRIAAICQDAGVTLVSRNRRDFELIPGLTIDYWD